VVRLGLSFKQSGLDLDRKIWQSADLWRTPVLAICARAYASGGWVGVNPPLWVRCFTKRYYLRNGD